MLLGEPTILNKEQIGQVSSAMCGVNDVSQRLFWEQNLDMLMVADMPKASEPVSRRPTTATEEIC